MNPSSTNLIAGRTEEVQRHYDLWLDEMKEKYGDEFPCPFCGDFSDHVIVKKSDHFMIVVNRFPYAWFDNQEVALHYMIIPLRHVDRFSYLNEDESREYMKLLALYHAKGYSVFTRSTVDKARSIPLHLHTHLFSYK